MDGQAYNLGAFDKLPAEIRNEIYELCLTTKEPLRVTRSRHGVGACKRHQGCVRIAYSDRFCLIVTTLTVPKRSKKVQVPAGSVISAALLRVSKAIQKESTPTLYRSNCFEFDTIRVLYNFFRTFTITTPLLADIRFNMVLKHSDNLDVLGNVENPKRLRVSSLLRDNYDSSREKELHAGRVLGALKPFIQRLCARPGSSSGRKQIATVEKQLQRLDSIQLDTSGDTERSQGGNEEERDVRAKQERERMAEFRELMAKEIEKDASETQQKKTM